MLLLRSGAARLQVTVSNMKAYAWVRHETVASGPAADLPVGN